MSRVLDKFTYMTTYKQEFCVGQKLPRDLEIVKDMVVECKKKFVPGTISGSVQDPATLGFCCCQAGGIMPPRGARALGQPTNLDKKCTCHSSGKNNQPTHSLLKTKIIEESREKHKDNGNMKNDEYETNKSNYKQGYSQEDEFHPVNCLECKNGALTQTLKPVCPPFKSLRPVPRGKYGGQFEGVLNMPAGREDVRNSGTNQERRDGRRESEGLKLQQQPLKRKLEDGGSNCDQPSRKQRFLAVDSEIRIPGPFWIRQRPDETKEVVASRKRKHQCNNCENRETVQSKRTCKNRFDSVPSFNNEEVLKERRNYQRKGRGNIKKMESEEDAQAEPFAFKKPCNCGAPAPESGPDKWTLEKDWGVSNEENGAAQGKDNEESKTEPKIELPSDVEETIRKPPAARLSSAPQSEISTYDQPNVFMKKLYEKYPYLYQVLKETPPEELVSKVFKDRFLSTYQVDYLHMGAERQKGSENGANREESQSQSSDQESGGQESGSQHSGGQQSGGQHSGGQQSGGQHSGGQQSGNQQFTGPDGEPEPEMIPGCSYRRSQKGDFGRKKPPEKDAKEKDDEPIQEEKEEPRISEYMATIGKLGNDIVQDQLFKVAQRSKNMKHQYNNV